VSEPALRILVFDLPPLLRDLVLQALDERAGVTAITAPAGDLDEAIHSSRPDAVIVKAGDGTLTPESRRWLSERSRPVLLSVGIGDGNASLYELEPRRTEYGAVAPGEIAALIRDLFDRKALT
jgi:hypothetical protein